MKDPKFASEKPLNNPSRVGDALLYSGDGPYTTRTGAHLYVAWVLPNGGTPSEDRHNSAIPQGMMLEDFLKIDRDEESQLKENVRQSNPDYDLDFSADRLYFQPDMPSSGGPAGNEFHRVRREILLPLSGRLEVDLEDVYGGKKSVELLPGNGLVVPPFIMHTLNILEPSSMACRANTLFMVRHGGEVIAIPDTYSRKTFEELQKRYLNS